MKFYGDFLVEKGIINGDQLLEAMVAQSGSSPAIPELVFKDKILSSEEQLNVFRTQQEKGCSYREAMHLSGVLTDDVNAKLISAVAAGSKHFIEFLLEKGYGEASALNAALDEFVSEYSDQIGKQGVSFTPGTDTSSQSPADAMGSNVSPVPSSEPAKAEASTAPVSAPTSSASTVANDEDISLTDELLKGDARNQMQSMLTNTLLEFQSMDKESLKNRVEKLKVESVKIRAIFDVYQCDAILQVLDKVEECFGKFDIPSQEDFENVSGKFLLVYDLYDRYLLGKPVKLWQKISESDKF